MPTDFYTKMRAKLKKICLLLTIIMLAVLSACSPGYYLDAPVSDPIMFVDDNQDSDLCRSEDGGLIGSAGECPT
jgi:hypothetical protein